MTTTPELPVKVLTCHQPWAWAIYRGYKRIENRDYKPSQPSRVLIHAGLKVDYDGIEMMAAMGIKVPSVEKLPFGVILCRVDVLTWEWGTAQDPFAEPGMWNWHLTNRVTARPPFPCRGRVSLYPPPRGWEQSFNHADGSRRGSK